MFLLEYFPAWISFLIGLLTIIGIFAGRHTFARYIAVTFDIFWNVMTGGIIGVTISSRAGIAKQNGKKWGIWLSWFLDKLEKNHCEMAISADIERAYRVIKELSPYEKK